RKSRKRPLFAINRASALRSAASRWSRPSPPSHVDASTNVSEESGTARVPDTTRLVTLPFRGTLVTVSALAPSRPDRPAPGRQSQRHNLGRGIRLAEVARLSQGAALHLCHCR